MAMKLLLVLVILVVTVVQSSPVPTSFGYAVADPITGDFKSQSESRVDGVVRGQYSLVQPDGLRRIVDYFADESGFHADVRYEPVGIPAPVIVEPIPAPVVEEPVVTRPYVPIPPYLGYYN